MNILTHQQLVPEEIMKKTHLLVVEIYVVIFIFAFSSAIYSFLQAHGIHEEIVKGLVSFLSVTLLFHAVKLGIDTYTMSISKSNEFITKKFEVVDEATNQIQRSLKEAFEIMTSIKEDNKEIHISIDELKKESMKTSIFIREMNEKDDTKKRRYREFEEDWEGMRGNIDELNNNDVYMFARSLKEVVRTLASEFQASDMKLKKDLVIHCFNEKYRGYKEKVSLNAKYVFEGDFIEYFFMKNKKNEDYLWTEINSVLDDRVNKRDEGIQIVMRHFLRKILTTTYLSWVEWLEANDEELRKSEIGRKYLVLHKESKYSSMPK